MEEKFLPSKIREYGRANLSSVNSNSVLLDGIKDNSQVWMSHGDTIILHQPSDSTVFAVQKMFVLQVLK